MDETAFVKKIQRGEDRCEHTAGFVRRERAAREKLTEIFVGAIGDDVEARRAVDGAASEMMDAKKSGMRKSSGGAPVTELEIGSGRIFGNQFYGDVGSRVAGLHGFRGKEDCRILRDTEKLAERETAVRELAQEMLRCC